ncbi:ribosomal protein S18 acetylase RimI-like enzyme [Pseudorhizobium tarimense]|uniref:Ribosomal protein S18 acetylase RimI-like enzyme n=1 Tax=Pseudorhizobium tarimense TaxID=1079109 RepID=A0ABV2HA66_9HYPH|nr:GNAT family N-acetyltransferase [Pseudorhizobium tarimense]MCJ8520577.1 GNAT family N-acetyltransferase [Pseudorhizobium tarimense]
MTKRLIRLAQSEEAERLSAVERSAAQAFLHWPPFAWLAQFEGQAIERHLELMRAGTNWLATDDDEIVGFLSAEAIDRELHIWELSVALDHQRLGWGSALLRHALQAAQARGLEAVTLTTFRNVPWNGPFYERFGFRYLTPEDVGRRLIEILLNEAEHGLPPGERCAMRLSLGEPASAR